MSISIGRTFLQGLVAVIPVAVTVYIVYWLGTTAEAVLGRGLRTVMPDGWYIPGMGLLAGAILVFLVGLALRNVIFKQALLWLERLVQRVPLLKSIYSTLRDVMGYFTKSGRKDFSQVVMMRYGDSDLKLMGFISRDKFEGLPKGIAEKDTVAVYLPMSYQIGGFTAYVPRSWLAPLEMSLEDAMRFTLTAGVSTVMKKENGEYHSRKAL